MKTGDRIRKRGFTAAGTIEKMDTTWATISWDDGVAPKERPRMCHVREIELLPQSRHGLDGEAPCK
jgi:hypothetical protein